MEATGSRATENLDSTARLMAEALAKASTELEKLVHLFCDHLSTFNQELGKSFHDEWLATEDRMEAKLRQTVEAMNRDREEALKKLGEYKQGEIQAIIDSGKEVRGRLAIKVDETAADFAGTLQEHVRQIQEHLAGPQADANARYEDMKGDLDNRAEALLATLKEKSAELRESISITAAQLELEGQQLVTATIAGIDNQVVESIEFIRTSHQEFAGEIESRQASVPARLESKRQGALDRIAEEEISCIEKLISTTGIGTSYAEEVASSFEASVTELSLLMTSLYDARLKNVLAQSRTEIVNAARKAEERVVACQNELRATLKEMQRGYSEKFEELYLQFETTVSEESKDGRLLASKNGKDARAREQLNALFRRLGQEMVDSAANAAGRVEAEFQRSVSTFEKRIESARDSACESLEREFKLMQKELSRTRHDFDKQLAELQNELQRIEKDGRDAAEIVLTIRSASLEF